MRTELYQWMKSLAFFHVLTTALLHILPDKRYEQYIRLFMGLLLVLLICTPIFAVVGKSEELLSGFSNNYGREEQVRMKAEDQNAEKTRLESRLEELLSNVEGVGEVEVIIMTGDEGNTENFSISSKNEVTGVLVAAQGAGSAVTVQNIQQAIMALFQIDANKIRIMKMK